MVRVHPPNHCGFREPYAGGVTLTGRELKLQLFAWTSERHNCNSSNTCSQVLRSKKFADAHRLNAFTAQVLPTKELKEAPKYQQTMWVLPRDNAIRQGAPTLEIGVAATCELIIIRSAHKEINGLPK